MDLSLFKVVVKRKPTLSGQQELHAVLYTDGKGYFYDLRPRGLGKKSPLFDVGDMLEIEESLQTIKQVESIPPLQDQIIKSIWEGPIAYSSSGFFGFKYFTGAYQNDRRTEDKPAAWG